MLPHALDIEDEHRAALATLSLDQRRAFERLAWAEHRSWKDGRSVDHFLGVAFAREASARSALLANDA